jgi:hypothetical protein
MKIGKTNLNSTDKIAFDYFARLFDTNVLKMHAYGNNYFLTRKSDNHTTYFETPKNVKYSGYSVIDLDSKESLAANLEEIWNDNGDAELAAMANDFADVAFKIRNVNNEDFSEISDLIYVMF